MPVSFHDKLRIVCYRCGLYEDRKFVEEFQKELRRVGRKVLSKGYILKKKKSWFDVGEPQERYKSVLIKMLDYNRPQPWFIGDVERLLYGEFTIYDFLDSCKVSWEDVSIAASDLLKDEMRQRFRGLHFLSVLMQHNQKKLSFAVLSKLIGTYWLYRKHSTLPGILREVLIISSISEQGGGGEGVYLQYHKSGCDEIPVNIFCTGSNVFIIGALDRENLDTAEIITMSVLINNMFDKDSNLQDDGGRFVGVLTGVYDNQPALLAERILLVKIGDGSGRIDDEELPIRITLDDRDHLAEYMMVRDVVSNAIDGSTLSARLDRLEMLHGNE